MEVWEHGEDSLKEFIETLNACHSTIKFTAEWSKEEINFLDVNVRLRNRQLETDLHIKPTDTRQFVDSASFDFVIQPLFSSIISHDFLFHFSIRSFGENSGH